MLGSRSATRGQAKAHGQLDQETLGEEAVQGRLGRARQQNGEYRVGRPYPKGSLPPLRTGSLRAALYPIGKGSR